MAERYVRFRYFHWYVPVEDPITGATYQSERFATHGMKVSTEESGDEPHTAYGLSEDRLKWGDLNGAFFSEAEVKAMEAGLTDTQLPMESMAEPRGDVGTSVAGTTTLAQATAAVPPAVHPVAFEELDAMQLAEYIKSADLGTDDLLAIAAEKPAIAEGIYAAATIASGGEAPEGLAEGIAEIMSQGQSEAADATEGDGPGGRREGEGDMDAPEGADDPNATDAAVELAAENGVDLEDVTGSGADGKITKQDVQDHLDAQ